MHSLDVGTACARLALATKVDEFLDTDRECTYTPLETLSCGVVKERVRGHLEKLFVEAVAGEVDMNENEKRRRRSYRRLLPPSLALTQMELLYLRIEREADRGKCFLLSR